MGSDSVLARPGAAPIADPPPPLLDSEWANRSADELRQIVEHGLRGGESFEGAARELERRARTVTQQAEEASEAERVGQRTFVRFLVGGLVLVAVIGLIIGLFFI